MKTKQFFFALIGVLVVLTAGLGYGYDVEVGRIKTETAALAKKSADATIASEKLDQMSDLKAQFAQLKPVLSTLSVALPTDKNQSVVILQIQQIAAIAGMKLPSASFQASNGLPSATSQTVKNGSVLALPISFQLSGTYAQLQSFLQQLQHLGRYNTVTSLAITRGTTSALSFSMTLSVYIKP